MITRLTWSPTSLRPRRGSPARFAALLLTAERAIEVGNIFKLGTRYSKALGAEYLDAEGISHPIFMGRTGSVPGESRRLWSSSTMTIAGSSGR